jgi:carbon-monoxide dehydrogenase small subunit
MSAAAGNRLVALSVNGQTYSAEAEPRLTLVDFLRHKIGLTGTHIGCEHGVCGACTVLVDGRAVRSCLMFAVQADGTDVQTVEGWGRETVSSTQSRPPSAHTTVSNAGSAHPGS